MVYEKKEIEELIRVWDTDTIMEMIELGFPPEKISIKNRTDILLESIRRNSKTIFKASLNAGFPILKGNFSYLHHAVLSGNKTFIQDLFNYVEDEDLLIHQKGPLNNFNILHTACQNNIDQDIILFLSFKGADWEEQNTYEQTPLHLLVRNCLPINQYLLEEIKKKEVDFDIKDTLGISVRDIVESLDYDENWQLDPNNKELIKYIRENDNEF